MDFEFTDLVAIYIAFVTATAGLVINEQFKRMEERRKHKSKIYEALIRYSHGFKTPPDKDLVDKFIAELRVSWIYCPDHIVRYCNSFILSMHEKHETTNEQRKQAMFSFLYSMRKDLYGKRTKLNMVDFHVWTPTEPKNNDN